MENYLRAPRCSLPHIMPQEAATASVHAFSGGVSADPKKGTVPLSSKGQSPFLDRFLVR
jgi:hypothetical protein